MSEKNSPSLERGVITFKLWLDNNLNQKEIDNIELELFNNVIQLIDKLDIKGLEIQKTSTVIDLQSEILRPDWEI